MLTTRLISAGILAPIVVAIVLLGEPWLSLMVGLLVFLAMAELISLLDAAGFEPPQVVALGAGLVVAGAGLVAANQALVGGTLADLLRATTPPGLPTVAYAARGGRARDRRLRPVGSAQGVPDLGHHLVRRGLHRPADPVHRHGRAPRAVGRLLDDPDRRLRAPCRRRPGCCSCCWWCGATTPGAYLTGRWLGRRHLIDHISPSKTVEGLVGGLLAATVAAGIGSALVGLDPWQPLVIGPLIGLAAQAGDLAESMVKRAAGRKESGFLVPGHGGILDRIDSFLFAAPVLVGYALLVAGFSL